jgi:hypothetical protein
MAEGKAFLVKGVKMNKFSPKQIGIAGAALAIGAAAFLGSQSFANASPSTAPIIVAPSISGSTSSVPDVAGANEVADNGPDVQQTGNYNDGTPDVAGTTEGSDNGPDVQQTGNYNDGIPDVAGASETVDSNN